MTWWNGFTQEYLDFQIDDSLFVKAFLEGEFACVFKEGEYTSEGSTMFANQINYQTLSTHSDFILEALKR